MKWNWKHHQFKRRRLQQGECLFEEGDPGDYAYILEEGEIEIAANIKGQRTVLRVLKAGSLFGELALIDDSPRSAAATALTDSLLTVVTRDQVNLRFEEADPILRMLMLSVMRYFRSEMARLRPSDHGPKSLQLPFRTPAEINARIVDAVDLIRMESELRLALEEDQFFLLYQPIVTLSNLETAGFEALLRWESPSRGCVSPATFVALAESTSLIVPIGRWIIDRACRDLQTLQAVGRASTFVSINVASRQVEDDLFVNFLADKVRENGLQSQHLKLEILERTLFENDSAFDWIQTCRDLGFPLALDDFGTGYSALEYLNDYSLDGLKIDKSFVQKLGINPRSYALCRTIIELAHALEMTVVAEGIETVEQVQLLQQLGCDYGQGYYFSRPVSLDAAIALEKSFVRLGG